MGRPPEKFVRHVFVVVPVDVSDAHDRHPRQARVPIARLRGQPSSSLRHNFQTAHHRIVSRQGPDKWKIRLRPVRHVLCHAYSIDGAEAGGG
jgi:hypothetical protein